MRSGGKLISILAPDPGNIWHTPMFSALREHQKEKSRTSSSVGCNPSFIGMRLSSERGQGTASLDPINFSYSADSAGPLTAELYVSSFEYVGCAFHQEFRISNQRY